MPHGARVAQRIFPRLITDEIYGPLEEKRFTRMVVKGSVRELLPVIAELVGHP